MQYILFTCPLPPSVNESLASVNGRLIKTLKSRKFLTQAIDAFKTDATYRDALSLAGGWVKAKYALKVDCYFVWPRNQILTTGAKAQNWAHRRDAHNRIKQLHDALSEAMMIDDMYFFAGDTEKIINDKIQEPYAMVRITKHTPRTIHDLWRQFQNEDYTASNKA